MESQLAKTTNMTPDLRGFLKILHGEIEAKLQHPRKVMLMDIINHVNRLSREAYDLNKEFYSKLMVIINVAMKAGKFYFEDL